MVCYNYSFFATENNIRDRGMRGQGGQIAMNSSSEALRPPSEPVWPNGKALGW